MFKCVNIFMFNRQFKIMDDDRSKSLSFEEFKKGIHDFGLVVADDVSKSDHSLFIYVKANL